MVVMSRPAQGSTNWFSAVDGNWATLQASVDQATCEGRLTLSSTLPVTTSDVTGATTLYYLPYKGNIVSLYNGTSWQGYTIPASGGSALSLSLSGLVANVTYDIYIYNNSGTLTLVATAWKSVTATNNPSSGSNVVINVSDTSGVSVGSLVTVAGGGNNEIAIVTAVSVNTSITVASLVNSYTTPTVYYPTRATALSVQNGIYVSGSNNAYRFLGLIRITSTAGQCEDSKVRRFVCNYYNRRQASLFTCPGYTNNNSINSFTTSSTSWVEANGGTGSKVELLSNGEDAVHYRGVADIFFNMTTSDPGGWVGVGENSPSSATVEAGWQAYSGGVVNCHWNSSAARTVIQAEGYNYLDLLVVAYVVTITFYVEDARRGASADPYLTYLEATVMV